MKSISRAHGTKMQALGACGAPGLGGSEPLTTDQDPQLQAGNGGPDPGLLEGPVGKGLSGDVNYAEQLY